MYSKRSTIKMDHLQLPLYCYIRQRRNYKISRNRRDFPNSQASSHDCNTNGFSISKLTVSSYLWCFHNVLQTKALCTVPLGLRNSPGKDLWASTSVISKSIIEIKEDETKKKITISFLKNGNNFWIYVVSINTEQFIQLFFDVRLIFRYYE